jgi:uncharacterized repeat protein (TIGR01451 family)
VVNNATGNHPAANDNIFIYESNTSYTLTSTLVLLAGQRLIGQDSSTSLQILTGLTPPLGSMPLPVMNSSNGTLVNINSPSTTAISLGANNRLYGFTIGQSALSLSGTDFVSLTVRDVTINTTGAAMMLASGTTDAIFTSVTASGGAGSVNLNVNGSLDLGNGALSGATGTALLISGGSASITYTGSINSSARSVNITGKTGGSVTFNGLVNGTGTGVAISSNTNTTVNFNGGVNLNTAANNAFSALNNTSGAVNVLGASNTLATTAATALRIENTIIGASGLTFRSISSNGGTVPGIRLNTTGSFGGLTVTGDGGNSNNGSGGVIQNMTVNGIELLNTQGVSLGYMVIQNNLGSGIYADSVTGFTLKRSNVVSNSDTFDGSEANLRFGTLNGNSAIVTSTISNSPYDNIRLTPTSGTLNLTISASTIGPNSATTGNNGISVIGTGTAVVHLTVNGNSQITGSRASGLLTSFSDTSVQDITVSHSALTNNNIGVDLGGISAADWHFNVSDNALTNHATDAIFVLADSAPSATTVQGTINNNIIGNGMLDSGARDQYGIHISQRESARLIVAITNNVVHNTDLEGIFIHSGDITPSNGSLDLTLTNNNVTVPDDNSGFAAYPNGIQVRSRRSTALCANIANNSSLGVAPGTGYYLGISDASTFGLQGYATSVTATLASNRNTGNISSSGTAYFSCTPATPVAAAISSKVFARMNSVAPATKHQSNGVAQIQSALQQVAQDTPALDNAFTYVSASQPQQSLFAGLFGKSLYAPLTAGSSITVGSFTLPPGKSITITLDADVDTPVAPGINRVSNQGNVSGGNFSSMNSDDPNTLTPNDPTITQLDIQSDLVLAMNASSARAIPGDTISYTLTFTNAGPQPAYHTAITNVVPANTTFSSASSTAGWNCTPGNTPGSICVFGAGQLLSGASGSTVFATTVNNPAASGVEQITNTASIGSDSIDPVTSTNSASVTTPVDAAPDLALVKSAGVTTITPGNTITYALVLTNTGNQSATGIVLTETVPANSTYDAAMSSIGWSCPDGSAAGSLCTLGIGNAASGTSVSRQFATTVISPVPAGAQHLVNQAVVADDGTNGIDLTPANNIATATTTIDAHVVMSLTLSDGVITVQPGETITYTLLYTNSGDVGAGGFILTETVPANTTFDPTISTPGWSCAPDGNAGSVCTLNPGGLSGGANGSVTFGARVLLQVPQGVTQILDIASIGDDGSNGSGFSTSGNGIASDTTPLDLRADLEIRKVVEPTSAFSGERITYTISYTNNGPQPSANVIISDSIPTFLTNLSVNVAPIITPTGDISFTWEAGILQIGQGGIISISGDISPNLTASGRYTNTASITGTHQLSPDNNVSTAAIDVSVPQIHFSDTSYNVAEDASPAIVTVTIAPAPTVPVSVDYATSDDTALGSRDFAPTSGSLTFIPGQTILTITVPITDDNIYENDESLNLALSNPVNANIISPTLATLVIHDNEPIPTVQYSESNFSVGEADGNALVTVTLSGSSAYTTTVDVSSSDGTASSLADYASVHTMVQFPPLNTVVTFSVPITDDLVYETNETVSLALSNPSGVNLGSPAQATLTIVDNDALPTVQFSTPGESVSEAGGAAVVSITLDHPSAFTITAAVSSTNETASSISDYAPISTVVTFTPGMTLVELSVPITNDSIYEGNETFSLSLTHPVAADLGTPDATQVTIVDDDPAPIVRFSGAPYSANESAGSVPVTVTLDRVSVFTVTASLSSTNGTASAPADYIPISQVVTFAPGEVTHTIYLTLVDNNLYEGNKTLWLALSDPTGSIISGTNPVQFTIINDDPPPTVQFNRSTYSASEASGETAITVTLNTPSGMQASVAYTVSNGSATSPLDFLAATGVLTFAPGETCQFINVTLYDYNFYDGDRTVHLSLGEPLNADLGIPATAVLTITDNEPRPSVQFSSGLYSVTESDLHASITVTLSGPSIFTTTVSYATSDGSALQSGDYVSTSGVLVFAPGITTQIFVVDIISDSVAEPAKTLSLTLSNPVNTSLAGTNPANLVIQDDDFYMAFLPMIRFPDAPAVQFSSPVYTISEGAGSALITATLNWSYPLTAMVHYTASDGSAVAPGDYGAVSGTLVFSPGVTLQSFNVPIVNDALYESDETVLLSLGAPLNNATAGSINTATLVIVNDDSAPTIQFNSSSYAVLESTGVANITVTLTAPAGITATAHYATSNGTAIAPDDYITATGVVTFAPGVTTQVISIRVVTDTLREAPESLTVALSNATYATLGSPAAATLSIIDDTAPDLIVQSKVVSSDQVTVVIRNIGSAAVVDEFWVDAYINPDTPPTHVNQIWSSVGTRGLAWGVTSSALPLAPGAALTLTVNGPYYSAQDSNMGGPIASGTPVYAQVDSVNIRTNYGNVLETHEITGGPYNNIIGPFEPSMDTYSEQTVPQPQIVTSSFEALPLPSRR